MAPPKPPPIITKTSSVFIISSDGRALKLPIPSHSPSDPLNWTRARRTIALGSLFLFSIIGLVLVQGSPLLIIEIKRENAYTAEHIKGRQVNLLGPAASLAQGISALLWVPLSIAIGRRPVLILSSLILTLSTLWAALSGSFYQHLVARCFLAFSTGISCSTILLMIIDLTFIHERPQAIAGFWSLCATISNMLSATTPYVISAGGTWRAYYWVWLGPCILSWFMILFFVPETYFQRPGVAFDGHILVQSATEEVKVYKEWDEVPGGKTLPDTPEPWWTSMTHRLFCWETENKGGWKGMRSCYPQVLLCILNPLLFWVVILNALVLDSTIALGSTYFTVLSNPPYNLPLPTISLIPLYAAIGCLLAWPAAGILTAKIGRALAVRNKGMHDPEHYLPSFILPVAAGAASVMLYGTAVEQHWNAAWIFFCIGLNYFSFIALFTSNSLWIIEAFPQWAAAAIAATGSGTCIFGFMFCFFVGPWVKANGFQKVHIIIGLSILGASFVAIPIAFCGKKWRARIDAWMGQSSAGALRPL